MVISGQEFPEKSKILSVKEDNYFPKKYWRFPKKKSEKSLPKKGKNCVSENKFPKKLLEISEKKYHPGRTGFQCSKRGSTSTGTCYHAQKMRYFRYHPRPAISRTNPVPSHYHFLVCYLTPRYMT